MTLSQIQTLIESAKVGAEDLVQWTALKGILESCKNELGSRGILIAADTTALQAQSSANTKLVFVRNVGMFQHFGTSSGGVNFPAAGGGYWGFINGGESQETSLRTVFSNMTLTASDDTVLVSTAAGNLIISVDPALTTKVQRIKKISSDANTVTVQPTTGTIEGVASIVLTEEGDLVTFQSTLVNLVRVDEPATTGPGGGTSLGFEDDYFDPIDT